MEEIKHLIEKTGLMLAKEVDGLEQIFNRYENMVTLRYPKISNSEIKQE
jgi:hypothetical protein